MTFYKELAEIQKDRSFERLNSFKDPKIWGGMAESERSLFVQLLILQGDQQLEEGSNRVIDSFNLAAQVGGGAPSIYYEQGNLFSKRSDNLRCLNFAHQSFQKAIQKNPQFANALYADGLVLLKMGLLENDTSYFVQACSRFEELKQTFEKTPSDFPQDELYWKWGLSLALIGKSGGEPHDYSMAIEKYRLAEEKGCASALFYIDYGNALSDLADLLERPALLSDALAFYFKAIELDPYEFSGWFNQGSCLLAICETCFDPQLCEQAEKSFDNALELDETQSLLWLRYGQLEALAGKYKRQKTKLESSLEKFNRAYQLDPAHLPILSAWAETELFLGSEEDRLDLIYSARDKIVQCLEQNPENAEDWYLYGSCLNEIGGYFNEKVFYRQAIEKFEYGVTLSSNNPLLWYGLALSHFALGELLDEKSDFEKAVEYCSKVIECGGAAIAQFWNDWGVALMKMGEMTQQPHYLEQAIEKFERALKQPLFELEPEDLDLEWVYNYGCAFDLLGDLKEEPQFFERAVQILNQVLVMDPDFSQARYNLALALSNLGEATYDVEPYQRALEHFQILLNNDQEDDCIHLDCGVSLVNLALLIHDEHVPERSYILYREAENHLMQAASLGNTQAYYQLVGLYSLTKHFAQAMHYLERALQYGALPPLEDLLHDEWLEALRQTPSFRQFIHQLSSSQSNEDK
ncbi:MAG: tetratricopeptide repeat protein [Parachlamydia sp.]|jgi:tetratricopeptide (TPR) repeat protein|nr:tetratricopeptide repeat protein [Parachlamydia sp.]